MPAPRAFPRRMALALAVALVTAATALAQQPQLSTPRAGGPESEIAPATAPVVLGWETLFRLRGASVYPAEERARRVSERILQAARTPTLAPESVRAVPAENMVNIVAGDLVLLGVTNADAQLEALDRDVLAAAYVVRIQRALSSYREARQPAVLLRGVRQAAVATVALLAALIGLGWVYRRLEARFGRRVDEKIRSLQIQSFEILRAQRIRGAVRGVLGLLRFAVIAVLVYFWLQLVLSSFPATHSLAARLLGMVTEPIALMVVGLVAALPDLAFLLVLFLLTRWSLRLARLFFDAVDKGHVTIAGFEPEWALPTYRIVRMVGIALAAVVAYPYIPGSRSAAFQGISLFLGVMLSIGSSSFVSNIIAGYSMTYRRAFRVGDRIRVGDITGDVTEVRLQVTHLRSLKNEEIVVPNSTLLNSSVVNYTALARSHGLILHTTVGIGYETPWRQVEAMLLLATGRTPGLAREPAPFVLQRALGDFCVSYELNAYCNEPSRMALLYSELHRSILDVFNEYGVQIMTPSYESDPTQPKLVPKEQWWTAPAAPPSGTDPKP